VGVPGEVLVVEALMPQAAVQDADEPVGEDAEGLVVGRAVVALSVVERPGAR
jgi:hypothetical protein